MDKHGENFRKKDILKDLQTTPTKYKDILKDLQTTPTIYGFGWLGYFSTTCALASAPTRFDTFSHRYTKRTILDTYKNVYTMCTQNTQCVHKFIFLASNFFKANRSATFLF